MRRGIFSLRRLRWKLTLSYTLVTVVALLALELILVMLLVAFLNSPVVPRIVAGELAASVAPRLEPYLSQTPPDYKGLREELRLLFGMSDLQETYARDEEGSDVGFLPEDGHVFVVDKEQRLVASLQETDELPYGERFETERFPGLEPILTAALDGEEDPWRLQASTPEGRWVLTVAPVEGPDGRTLGAVAAVFPLPDLTGPLLVMVGLSAIGLAILAAPLGMVFGFLTAWGLTRRLQRLVSAARAWSRGDFSVAVRDRSRDELGQLSTELNDMAAQLEGLIEARQELATLEARNRFARDLHDSVKQQVFATSLRVAAARALIGRDQEAAESHLEQADQLVRQAQTELNALIHEMRPAALEGKGLANALRDYTASWSEGSEIPIKLYIRGERELPLETEQAMFRIAQEALANVARHSGAERAEIDLIYDTKMLTLRVTDNGRGFVAQKASREGLGLQSMRERLAKLGGHLEIASTPGKGTRVEGVCPLNGAAAKKGGNQ